MSAEGEAKTSKTYVVKEGISEKRVKEQKSQSVFLSCCSPGQTRRIRNKKVKGKVLIDETGNKELWQKIIDNSLIGVGVVAKTAICNIELGAIIAYSPEDFTPTHEQVQYLANVVEEPDRCSITGIKVADLHFIYRSGMENKALFGHGIVESDEPDQSGVIVYVGQTKIMICVYEANKRDTAKKTCAELFEYFVNEQNGF